jgi:hypothetical protein
MLAIAIDLDELFCQLTIKENRTRNVLSDFTIEQMALHKFDS